MGCWRLEGLGPECPQVSFLGPARSQYGWTEQILSLTVRIFAILATQKDGDNFVA